MHMHMSFNLMVCADYMLLWIAFNGVILYGILTYWGRAMHICVGKLTIIGSDNGLSPDWRQAIIWTNAGLLLIGPLGTNFNEILIEILTFSFKKIRLKVSSAKRRPFCLGLNVLNHAHPWWRWWSGNFTMLILWCVQLVSRTMKYIYLYFLSFLSTQICQVIEILPHRIQ